jgi:transposase
VLAVLVYSYCVGERSPRRIERRLVEDVAFRVVGANQLLDHATLARFRRRYAEAIGQVLGLCVKEGLVDSKVISIDGTKIEANASAWANRTYNWARQLLDDYQVGRGDPAVLRKQKPAEQGLPRASC